LSSISTYPIRSSDGGSTHDLGSVEQDGSTVIVTLVSEETISREYYGIMGDDSFVYNIDLSTDGGETLNTGSIEFTMTRVQ
jgi:hypothetical protein